MSIHTPEAGAPRAVEYPDSDGLALADNTEQFRWIAFLATNADTAFRADPSVFVGGNLLVYAVEGDPKARAAPDVLVAFGRPKGRRGSYRVWDEGGIFPQVVIEVVSPGNRPDEMGAKFAFYERHGAAEYLVVYPEERRGVPPHVEAWLRRGDLLVPVEEPGDYVSPHLGFRFSREAGELVVYGRNGQLLRTHGELTEERDEAIVREAEAKRAEAEARRAEVEARRAEAEARRAAGEAAAATERLAAKLRALGLDPDAP